MAMFGMDNEKKTLLVQEVYRRPLIWKVTDPRYNDIPARWLAFEEIAEELSDEDLVFTSDMIKVAWKNMMDYYNQIRRRHDRAVAAGVEPPDSKWQFFNMMHFTRQDKPPVKRRYNWMQPSKIPRSNESLVAQDDEVLIQMRHNYEAAFVNNTMISKEEAQRVICITPRTKESEKARLRAKREALRDANIVQSTASPVANGTFAGTRNGNKISYNRTRAAARAKLEAALTETGESDSDYLESSESQETKVPTRRRGRHRRDIYSPEPGGATSSSKYRSATPATRSTNTSPKKMNGAQKSQVIEHASTKQAVADTDSSLIFAEHVATRLFKIKEKSLADYYRICDTVEKLLDDAETALDIVDTDIMLSD
uniref:MADF domain-containing protein n=1 Tax=Elaeophora elaphi TaxID=1147741 RepID=A0A0R3RG24_9BILA